MDKNSKFIVSYPKNSLSFTFHCHQSYLICPSLVPSLGLLSSLLIQSCYWYLLLRKICLKHSYYTYSKRKNCAVYQNFKLCKRIHDTKKSLPTLILTLILCLEARISTQRSVIPKLRGLKLWQFHYFVMILLSVPPPCLHLSFCWLLFFVMFFKEIFGCLVSDTAKC